MFLNLPKPGGLVAKFLILPPIQWVGQDGDWIGLEAGAGSLPGFELAIEDDGGKGESFSRQAAKGISDAIQEKGARHDHLLGGPR